MRTGPNIAELGEEFLKQNDEAWSVASSFLPKGHNRDAIKAVLRLPPPMDAVTPLIGRAVALAEIFQKAGYLEDSEIILGALQPVEQSLPKELRKSLSKAKVKTMSQRGEFEFLRRYLRDRDFINLALSGRATFRDVSQSIARRVVISGAILNDSVLIQQGRRILEQYVDQYGPEDSLGKIESATNEVFDVLAVFASSPHDVIAELENYRLGLAELRSVFYSCPPARNPRTQTNPEKTAHATVFLEGVFELYANNVRLGMWKLYLASRLNVMSGGGACSEIFGDVLATIRDSKIKELVTLSMRRDSAGRKSFVEAFDSSRKSDNNHTEYLALVANITTTKPEFRETATGSFFELLVNN